MRFLKEFLTALLVMAFSMAMSAKVNVTNGDYKLAEVTGNNINIRSGAGTEYPIAYEYDTFGDKTDVSPAFKGSRYWVKDAGDWWEIYTREDSKGSKKFITKKYCQLVETDPFDVEAITEPQVYVYSKTSMVDGDRITDSTVITIYPGGLVVTQSYDGGYTDCAGDLILGSIMDNGAICDAFSIGFNYNYGLNPNAKLDIVVGPESPYVELNIGEKNMSSFKWKGKNIEYVDISGVSPDKWMSVLNTNKSSWFPYENTGDAVNWTIRDDLKEFVRIK